MGLDMYLYRCHDSYSADDLTSIHNYICWAVKKCNDPYTESYSEWCGEDESDMRDRGIPELAVNYINAYGTVDYGDGYYGIFESVGYWRKANQIHGWLVDNVQCGVDDCKIHVVQEWAIRELLRICEEVKSIAVMKPGVRKYEQNYDVPDVIENWEEVAKLLPTTHGCFFGSTEYDGWYMDDIDDTIKILKKILAETDFEEYVILYRSSW